MGVPEGQKQGECDQPEAEREPEGAAVAHEKSEAEIEAERDATVMVAVDAFREELRRWYVRPVPSNEAGAVYLIEQPPKMPEDPLDAMMRHFWCENEDEAIDRLTSQAMERALEAVGAIPRKD